MSEQNDFGTSLLPHQDENSAYILISPNDELLRKTTKYLHAVQKNASHAETAFIPTGLGMIITPDKRQFIFSMYGAGQGNIYDLAPLETPVSGIETSGVLFCGVTTASFEGYKLLTHAGGPEAVKELTSRGIDLAKQDGATLQTPIEVIVSCNPLQGDDIYVNGPKGYTPQIKKLAQEMGIKLNVLQIPVSQQAIIKI